jgi:hypothetical protein
MILGVTKSDGHIKGLSLHLIPGGVSCLRYLDDTIIMIQQEDLNIANLKFLLHFFENMSGLCINFPKREVMVLGTSPEEQQRITNILNCKLGIPPLHLPWVAYW